MLAEATVSGALGCARTVLGMTCPAWVPDRGPASGFANRLGRWSIGPHPGPLPRERGKWWIACRVGVAGRLGVGWWNGGAPLRPMPHVVGIGSGSGWGVGWGSGVVGLALTPTLSHGERGQELRWLDPAGPTVQPGPCPTYSRKRSMPGGVWRRRTRAGRPSP